VQSLPGYHFRVHLLLMAYVAGVLVGLWRADATPAGRVALALLWPAGLAACLVTGSILIAAAAVLFPLFGVALLAVASASWWMFR
jgi:hypothetical protein